MITVQLRYFASLREALGSSEVLVLDAPATVAEVRERLVARGGEHARLLGAGRAVRAALNQQLCSGDARIEADAEVAFFPPVTGG